MDYILSVIIPTKNRQYYCLKAVEQILSVCKKQNIANVEIVIQDNSENNELENQISKLNSNNVNYNYNGNVLSFVDNFSEAVSLAKGKYLCMLGDDDGILPSIFDALKYMEENDVDAFIPSIDSFYVWPMKDSFIKNGNDGYLCIAHMKNGIESVCCENSIKKLLYNGGQLYQKCDMPRLYHGVVSRIAVEKIKERTGKYFGGLTPDIYMSTALVFVCKRVVKCNIPITISGICTGSGSANSATGKHTGKLSDAPHFIGHESYVWSNKVPEIYSVETIWADTFIHALQDFNYDNIDEFNIATLMAFCYKKYPQFSTRLDLFVKNNSISKFLIQKQSLKFFKFALIKRLFKRVTRKKNDVVKYYGVLDIEMACERFCAQMNSMKIAVFNDGNN